MSGTSVFIYKQKDKKWHGFKNKMSIETNYYPLFLYQKYFPNWPIVEENSKVVPMESMVESTENFYKNIFQENLEWYERICLRLSLNGFYISKKSQRCVLQALHKMEAEYPTSTEHFPSFCRSMISLLSSYQLKDDEFLALGKNAGNFWGKDFLHTNENLYSNICRNFDEDLASEVAKYIQKNYNLNPLNVGKDICFDIKD